MTQLPQWSAPAGAGRSRSNVVARGIVRSDGLLAATVPARGVDWLARRIVIQGPASTICRLYTGEPGPTSLADGSQSGELDVADYLQPLYVEQGLPLIAVWTTPAGANVAGTALLRVELEELG